MDSVIKKTSEIRICQKYTKLKTKQHVWHPTFNCFMKKMKITQQNVGHLFQKNYLLIITGITNIKISSLSLGEL
jgi:hypothetical protein